MNVFTTIVMYEQVQDLLFDGSGALIPELVTNATAAFSSVLTVAIPFVAGVALAYFAWRHIRGMAKV